MLGCGRAAGLGYASGCGNERLTPSCRLIALQHCLAREPEEGPYFGPGLAAILFLAGSYPTWTVHLKDIGGLGGGGLGGKRADGILPDAPRQEGVGGLGGGPRQGCSLVLRLIVSRRRGPRSGKGSQAATRSLSFHIIHGPYFGQTEEPSKDRGGDRRRPRTSEASLGMGLTSRPASLRGASTRQTLNACESKDSTHKPRDQR
jgi:hypothetical protein